MSVIVNDLNEMRLRLEEAAADVEESTDCDMIADVGGAALAGCWQQTAYEDGVTNSRTSPW
jgi:hypothetical protein